MPENLKLQTAIESPSETDDIDDERLKEIYADFIHLIEARRFPPNIIEALKSSILPRMLFERTETGPSYHRHLYYTGEGGEGETKLIISERTIRSRAERLKNLVPEGTERQLAVGWLIGHELGHALETAYGIANKTIEQSGTFAGLPVYPSPMSEYLKNHPQDQWSPNFEDSCRIDSERVCEGLAQEILAIEMARAGMDSQAVIRALHRSYDVPRERATKLAPLLSQTSQSVPLRDIYDGRLDPSDQPENDARLAIHVFGYANPMPVDEAHRRYVESIRR